MKNEKESLIHTHSVWLNGHRYMIFNNRENGTVRHEIFFGTSNRKKSIEYQLYVFIYPKDHNMSEYGVHCNKGHAFDEYLKKLGQKKAMQFYGWSEDDFRKIFGKSYL